ncbi:MAG TPA: 50S ribosomal protein L25 [Candidatus Pacearchaeota archaeon]|nr:50S ribosomal protein L25 [Candidatus Pacearchaeota archaeon]
MKTLEAKTRKKAAEPGMIPAVLYGPGLENILLHVDKKALEKVFQEAGETLISLKVDNGQTYSVLIYDTQKNPLTSELIHIDFYQPNLKEEVETEVALEIEGEAPAVKNLEGTLITNIKELKIRALPSNLPNKIKVDVSGLKTFDDFVLVKDIKVPQGVTVLDNPEEIAIQVVAPEKIEEELAQPVEEKLPETEEAPTEEKKAP